MFSSYGVLLDLKYSYKLDLLGNVHKKKHHILLAIEICLLPQFLSLTNFEELFLISLNKSDKLIEGFKPIKQWMWSL